MRIQRIAITCSEGKEKMYIMKNIGRDTEPIKRKVMSLDDHIIIIIAPGEKCYHRELQDVCRWVCIGGQGFPHDTSRALLAWM